MTAARERPSFEDLDLPAELAEGLAAQGIEWPTALQAEAIPVIRRGNDLVLAAGPGSGALVACAAPVVARIEPDSRVPRALFLLADPGEVRRTATSLGRMTAFSGHRVGALGVPWARPGSTGILVATPQGVEAAGGPEGISLDSVDVAVVYGAASFRGMSQLDALERVLGTLPAECQRVLVGLPVGETTRRLAERYLNRAVYLPADAGVDGDTEAEPPRRGRIGLRMAADRVSATVEVLDELLGSDEVSHVVLFGRSEARLVHTGETAELHGFSTGRPGEEEVPVWLAADELAVRRLLREFQEPERVATLSVDMPFDADSLDRRHGAGGPALVLVAPRELAHLRMIARVAGYGIIPSEGRRADLLREEARRVAAAVERVLEEEDVAPHFVLLEPLLERWSPEEVAAALALLLRRTRRDEGTSPGPEAGRPPAWIRLFVSIGERDGVGPGDLLGAVTGEAGIEGSQVGKIEIRDTFSRIDVEESVAPKVVQALNGITFRGRSVRADYDRTESRGRGGGTSRGGRSRR